MLNEYINLFEKKIEKMENKVRKFKLITLSQLFGKYTWGSENVEETDCSGTVCLPLMILGYPIRVTAARLEELFKEEATEYSENEVQAIFYFKDGKVKHVTPIVGEGMIVNASGYKEEIKLEKAINVIKEYKERGYTSKIKKLNFSDLEGIEEVFGLDEELSSSN